MKRIYTTISLFAMMIAAFSFAACSSGDDEVIYSNSSSDNLEGIWYTTEDDWIFVITDDTITQYELLHTGNGGYSLNSHSLSWLYTINGNKIILNGEDPVAFSLNGDNLKFSGDGYVMSLTKYNGTLTQLIDYLNEGVTPDNPTPQDPVIEEYPFLNEQEFLSVLSLAYESFAQFEYYQQTIEASQLKGEAFNASSEIVYSAWQFAYSTITRLNLLINIIKNNNSGLDIDQYNKYVAEMTALRSFVFYQMTIMWGDVPYFTKPLDADDYCTRTDKDKILSDIYQSLDDVFDKMPNSSDNMHMGKLSAQILLSEISVALGNYTRARSLLSEIGATTDEDYFVVMSPNPSDSNLKVYNKEYVSLLLKELDGNRASAGNEWFSCENVYGVWAALKRLSLAKDLTGCDDTHLLLPIPYNEILFNQMMTQNPGY